jgi:hypothetical protein
MTREELIAECQRHERIAHKLWAAITAIYGPEGFGKVLKYMSAKKG